MKKPCFFVIILAFLFSFHNVNAQTPIIVNYEDYQAVIQPTMWGIFFEDINFAADGGIYAELVKNRSFEFYKPLMGWKRLKREDSKGDYYILNHDEMSENPRFVRLECEEGEYGFENEGFRGMGLKKDMEYNFSIWARKMGDNSPMLVIELLDSTNKIVGSSTISNLTSEWKQYKTSFTCSADEPKGRMNLYITQGTLDIDMVSLFPKDTWKQRENGLRSDLVQMLADLEPGFLRFPGGCIVEGHDLSVRYQWKKSVGPVEDRKVIVNRWNTEFMKRHTPDYFQSFGLGFYEYFLLAEDIGAEPLPIINCGMACQFNTKELATMDQLGPYIQDALDLVEFANGSTDTKWGKIRADMGHPEPFNLKYMGIGNEQWGKQYLERYDEFAKTFREKHPEIKLIGAVGPSPDDSRFRFLWDEFKKREGEVDLLDEHYYKNPDWFLANATRYDNYDPGGIKVFAGEYACHGPENNDPTSRNTWLSALCEAALMTGLERNAGAVNMCSYAPLFAHVDAWQWRPDLIWFDNLHVVGTPNYYVQKLYSTHKGTNVVPITSNDQNLTGQDSLYASATVDANKKLLYVKIANTSGQTVPVNFDLEGKSGLKGTGKVNTMSSQELLIYNTIEKPAQIVPIVKEIKLKGKTLTYSLEPKSFNVFEIPLK
ncbi:MAG: alpha-L-arabinofuranosidase [Bacteroidales bacterium]|nr:alpha-L-arabinofuranosidase [Bacteroidales bacterium]